MISRIKSLLSGILMTRLDKRRADLAMAWAQRHPLATSVYNLWNYLFLSLIKTGLFTVRIFSRIKGNKGFERQEVSGQTFPFRKLPEKPRVLLVVEDSIPQCFQYRVQQKLDMLQILGWPAQWLRWSDIEQVNRDIHFYDVILLYRVPGFPDVMSFIRYAASLNKLLIYDLDDLIFDRAQLELKFFKDKKQLSRKTYQDLLAGADLYKKVISEVPFCLVSTEPLRKEVEKINQVKAFVLPNGISRDLSSMIGTPAGSDRDPTTVHIIYGSGTRTHDADFLYISPALLELMSEHPHTRLIIVGPVNIDPQFEKFGDRIAKIDFLAYPAFLEVLSYVDINIAPLEPGIFGDCKSEIKWLEAGMLGVPSLVFKTSTYQTVIEQGVTGFMAEGPEQWKSILSELVTQADLRGRIGESAKSYIAKEYGLDSLSGNLGRIVTQCWEQHIGNNAPPAETSGKSRVLLVNTLYPPQAIGGATRIMRDLIAELRQNYLETYEICVFTCDILDTHPYRLRQYMHDGIVVTSLSVPMRPDLEIQHRDDNVKDIFKQFLIYLEPDIVHFHSIQRLTASTLMASEELTIPFVVTVHDSWWISDHPFMIDDKDRLLPSNISNPLVANNFSDDLNATLSRNRYLRSRLNRAEALVAVSGYQADLYKKNSFTNVQTIENGIDKPVGYTRHSGKELVLGYVGGKSIHKGYYFLKDNVTRSSLRNTRLVTVDLFSQSQEVRTEHWGGTPVEIHPKYDFSKAGAFYSMIDVLIVPSLWPESFGLVVREASLLGIWVVASASGGLSESIIDRETGCFFEPGNDEQFGEILLDLDHNWRRYKAAVNPHAIRKLEINSVARNALDTHKLYQGILSRSQVCVSLHN